MAHLRDKLDELTLATLAVKRAGCVVLRDAARHLRTVNAALSAFTRAPCDGAARARCRAPVVVGGRGAARLRRHAGGGREARCARSGHENPAGFSDV